MRGLDSDFNIAKDTSSVGCSICCVQAVLTGLVLVPQSSLLMYAQKQCVCM